MRLVSFRLFASGFLQLSGDADGAREVLLDARDFAAWLDYDEGRVFVEESIAALAMDVGDLEEARRVLADAVEEFPGARARRPALRRLLGDVLRKLQRWDEAREQLHTALDELVVPEDDSPYRDHEGLRCEILGTLGQVELDLGRLDRAAELLADERRLARELLRASTDEGDPRPVAFLVSCMRTADLYGVTNRYEEAIAVAAEGLEVDGLPADARAPLLAAQALGHSSLEERDPTRPRRARELLVEALPLLDDSYGIAAELELIHLALRDEGPAEAARWAAAARARLAEWRTGDELLLEHARLAALEGEVALAAGAAPDELRRSLTALRAAFASYVARWDEGPILPSGAGFLQWPRQRQIVSALVGLSLAADGDAGPESALVHVFEAQARGTLARRVGAAAPTLARAREALLGAGAGLLVYAPSLTRTYAFAIDADDVRVVELDPEEDLLDRARALQPELRSPPADDSAAARATELARDLADAVLPADLRAHIEAWSCVYVVGADLLGNAPFEALPTSTGPLGTTRPLAYLPSVPIGVWLAAGGAGARDARVLDLAVFAAPQHDEEIRTDYPELVPLDGWPGLDGELRRLSAAFPPERVLLQSGREMHPAALAAGVGQARLALLLTHGVFAPRRDRAAGLVVTPDQAAGSPVLWAEDVERIRAPELVFLGACGAARGPVRLGDDGVAHLGGALFFGGARTVVLTSNDVELRSALLLARGMFGGLASGETPAEAMRAARAELYATGGFEHPFYHAGLRVVGLAHQPLYEPAPGSGGRSAWWPFAAALGALACGALALTRRTRAAH